MKWPGRDVRRSDWRTATALALVTVLFGALIQVESFALYARGGGAGADAAFLLALPFLQLDSLLIGALLGAGHLVLARTRLRWGAVAVAVLVNAWVIVNQAGYGAVRQNLSVFDPDIALARVFADAPKLLSSVPASGVWLAVFNAIVLGASAEWVRRRVQSAPIDAELKWPLVTPARVVMATLWLVSSFLAPRVVDTHGLDRHAIVAALTPATIHFDANLAAGDSAFLRSPFDTSSADASDARLADIVSRARALHRPNVLLVVLESVGTEQLFPGGQADSTLTPTIARLARGGVLFPDVYSVSVSTTRAHLPMMTGGPVVTWGDANELFKARSSDPHCPASCARGPIAPGSSQRPILDSRNWIDSIGGSRGTRFCTLATATARWMPRRK